MSDFQRQVTFSKRKGGLLKKAYELSTLTGSQVLLVIASDTGHVYTFATDRLQPLITTTRGKTMLQQCLNGEFSDDDGTNTCCKRYETPKEDQQSLFACQDEDERSE